MFSEKYKYNVTSSRTVIILVYRKKLKVIKNNILKGYVTYIKDKSYYSHIGPWYNGLESKILLKFYIDNFKKFLYLS